MSQWTIPWIYKEGISNKGRLPRVCSQNSEAKPPRDLRHHYPSLCPLDQERCILSEKKNWVTSFHIIINWYITKV